jgi:hypothetical protein
MSENFPTKLIDAWKQVEDGIGGFKRHQNTELRFGRLLRDPQEGYVSYQLF